MGGPMCEVPSIDEGFFPSFYPSYALALSPDNNRIASGSNTGGFKVWSTAFLESGEHMYASCYKGLESTTRTFCRNLEAVQMVNGKCPDPVGDEHMEYMEGQQTHESESTSVSIAGSTWEAPTGTGRMVEAIAWSHDGKYIAIGTAKKDPAPATISIR